MDLFLERRIILNKSYRKIVAIIGMIICFGATVVQAANNTDKAWCQEYFNFWWHYDGNAQFVPSYKIPDDAGYSLKKGKNVKQAYINFVRKKDNKDVSVCGGRQYTKLATNKRSNSVYSVNKDVMDSFNIFTNKTRFYYGWLYF